MDTTRRAAGAGLAAYGLGTALAFMSINAPGGGYEDTVIVKYMASGHWALGMVMAYVGAFSALGLLVFAHGMRRELGSAGEVLWGLALAGTVAGVVGWFLVGGLSVSFAEGGRALTTLPHPVVYLVSEMSDLIAICASSFFVGVAAVVLAARADLSRALRITTYAAGACGVLAAFFLPLFLLWLWAIGFGVRLMVEGVRSPRTAAQPA